MLDLISNLIVSDNVNVGGTKESGTNVRVSVHCGAQGERLLPLPSDLLCFDIHTSISTLKHSTLSALTKYADFSR